MDIRNALLDAVALLSPVECAGCGADDRSLCAGCRVALEPTVALHLAGGLAVHSALDYAGQVRRVILAYKERGRTDVASPLAAALAAALRAALAAAPRDGRTVELCPVPTSRGAFRRRGYDPVRLLVLKAGGRPRRVLLPARNRVVQKSLGVADRAANLRGAFVAAQRLDGRKFVIVDDILTSGATISEAARAVRAAGGEVVAAATLAFTERLWAFSDNAPTEDYGGAKGAH